LKDARFDLVALDVGGEPVFSAEFSDRVALVLGNETSGIRDEVRNLCSRTVSLPLNNGVESLNVAVAASVVSYIIGSRREEP
ncbi:MAG: TrmH family RNA methyltransferase, partial [Actinomycetota bacterium]|nr:TrmH family RNA methyltransferase [Actinomycetota bacterium]